MENSKHGNHPGLISVNIEFGRSSPVQLTLTAFPSYTKIHYPLYFKLYCVFEKSTLDIISFILSIITLKTMKTFRLLLPLILVAAIFQRCQENKLVDNYILDSEHSTLVWHEHSNTISHSGTLKLVANNIKAEKGRIKSGTITIPRSSISTMDQTEKLPEFLNHNTFMNSDMVLQIKEVDLLHGIHPYAIQGANWWVRGEMTIHGRTHPISFPAKIMYMANDMDIEAKFTVDFAHWGKNPEGASAIIAIESYPIIDLHLKGKARIDNRIII